MTLRANTCTGCWLTDSLAWAGWLCTWLRSQRTCVGGTSECRDCEASFVHTTKRVARGIWSRSCVHAPVTLRHTPAAPTREVPVRTGTTTPVLMTLHREHLQPPLHTDR